MLSWLISKVVRGKPHWFHFLTRCLCYRHSEFHQDRGVTGMSPSLEQLGPCGQALLEACRLRCVTASCMHIILCLCQSNGWTMSTKYTCWHFVEQENRKWTRRNCLTHRHTYTVHWCRRLSSTQSSIRDPVSCHSPASPKSDPTHSFNISPC